MSRSLRVSFALVLTVGFAGCMDPKDQRPGLRLRGEVASELPPDWSFTNEDKEIAIEVATPYLVPHSVTIWCAANEQLYVAARNPEKKRWPAWVERDPNVRLRIAGKIYEVQLSVVGDPQQLAAVRRAYSAKYGLPNSPPRDRPPMRYWLVQPRS